MPGNLIIYFSRRGENCVNGSIERLAKGNTVESLDFGGKKVLPVVTHEGSGLASCERDLKKVCVGAKFGRGLVVHGADAAKSEEAVAAWARKEI